MSPSPATRARRPIRTLARSSRQRALSQKYTAPSLAPRRAASSAPAPPPHSRVQLCSAPAAPAASGVRGEAGTRRDAEKEGAETLRLKQMHFAASTAAAVAADGFELRGAEPRGQ